MNPLLEGVGSGSPPGQDNGKTDSLDELGSDANSNSVEGTLLGEDLRDVLLQLLVSCQLTNGKRLEKTYTGSRSSEEDETTEISSTLVAQSTSSVDQSTDTVRLESRADERRTPGEGSAAGLLGADELLLGVGDLGALVGGTEDGGEDGELNTVVKGRAEGNGRGLDSGKVCDEKFC